MRRSSSMRYASVWFLIQTRFFCVCEGRRKEAYAPPRHNLFGSGEVPDAKGDCHGRTLPQRRSRVPATVRFAGRVGRARLL